MCVSLGIPIPKQYIVALPSGKFRRSLGRLETYSGRFEESGLKLLSRTNPPLLEKKLKLAKKTLGYVNLGSLLGIRSTTFVTKNISLHTSKRSYPLVVATASVINQQLALSQTKLLFNKAIFLRYCQHFEKYSLPELLNDHHFIQLMSRMLTEAPSLQSRAFQLALEVSYSRRKFSSAALQEYFQADFTLKDVYDSNRGLCDQSTVYSSILMKFVKSQLNLDATSIQVNVTPLYLPKEKSHLVEQAMANNQMLTGNRSPDALIYNKPYDIKDSQDFLFNKNHIYIIDSVLLEEKSHLLVGKIIQSLQSTLQGNTDNAIDIYAKKLLFLARNKNSSIEKIDILNKFMVTNPPPTGFRFPFLISKPHVSLEDLATPLEKLEKIPLDHGHLDYTKARKALLGILEEKPTGVQCGIELATHRSIQFPHLQTDDNPI